MTDMFLADRAPGHFHSMTRQAWLGGVSTRGGLCGLAKLYNCDSQRSHASLIAHLRALWHECGTEQVSGFVFSPHTSLSLYTWMFGPAQSLRKVLQSYIRIQPTWPCSEVTKHHILCFWEAVGRWGRQDRSSSKSWLCCFMIIRSLKCFLSCC